MTVVRTIRRLRDEFPAMPGLRLTAAQVQRLCDDGGAACVSRLREMLRDAPCHVLIVHASGQAAVA